LLLLICAIFISSPFTAQAASLSPAIEVLSNASHSVKAGLYNCDVVFTEIDFAQATGITNFGSITLTETPPKEDGVLMIGTTAVEKGQTVSSDLLSHLRFKAASAEIDETEFSYSLQDKYGNSIHTCKIVFLNTLNEAPVAALPASAPALTTFKNVAIYSCLTASDPEGDKLTYKIVEMPKKGQVELLSAEYGDFKYTPKKNFTGKDSFSYVVCDEYGNYSKTVKVTVKTVKDKSRTTLDDMKDTAGESAAITVLSLGLMNSKRVGSDVYFDPDGTVSRAELLCSIMEAAGIDTLPGDYCDVFSDNKDIPEKYKEHVSTAVKLGYIKGYSENGKLSFRPNEPVTRAEAAVMANAILSPDSSTVQTFADAENAPDWAGNAINAAVSNRLLYPVMGNIKANDSLTRAECAIMLAGICSYK